MPQLNKHKSIQKFDFNLDITGEVCPLTFVKTKLLIEKMQPGQTVEVRLAGAEPLENIPRSVTELGPTILSLEAEKPGDASGVHLLQVRKEKQI